MPEPIHSAACACPRCTPPAIRRRIDWIAAAILIGALLALILPAASLLGSFTWGTI